MNESISMYGLYQGKLPQFVERGSILFLNQQRIMMLTYSLLGLKEFHPLRVEVKKDEVYLIEDGVFALLKQVPAFESEEYT